MCKSALALSLALLVINPLQANIAPQEPTKEAPADDIAANGFTWAHDRRLNTKKAEPKKEPNVTIGAEFLYWQPTVHAYTYAQTGWLPSIDPTTESVLTTLGTSYVPPHSFKPGFRVSLSGMPEDQRWGIKASYLWFYSSNKRVDTTTTQAPFATMTASATSALALLYSGLYAPTKVNFDWNQHYQIADLVLERSYKVNDHLKLRPFVGALGTWQNKNFNTTFSHNEPLVADLAETPVYQDALPFDVAMYHNNKFWGLGVVGGIESSWFFNKYIAIYGSFSISELWLDQQASITQDMTYVGENPTDLDFNIIEPVTYIQVTNTAQNQSTIKTMFNCSLGLRGQTSFSDDKYHFAIQVGWEAQYWPNQFALLHSPAGLLTNTISESLLDFSVQGLTAKLEFGF